MSEGPDLAALLSILERHRVAFVVAGSVGALAQGVPGVSPRDLDVVPARDAANLRRLAEVLGVIGATSPIETGAWQTDEAGEHAWVEDGIERPAAPLDPGDPDTFDRSFATAHGRLDVVPRVAGSYAPLRPRATRRRIAGHEAWVAHPIDLLAGMTRPRRAKDGPRVRHLRSLAAEAAHGSGVGFVGFRTDRFTEMLDLFGDLIGLEVLHEAPGATRFRLGADAELHVYAGTDSDHAFFTTGPVVGLRVEDVDVTRGRMVEAGLEMLNEVERTPDAAWCHLRAPDGTVIEIIGPPFASRAAG